MNNFFMTAFMNKKVKIKIFTESAPTPIQSSSRNVHYKNKALKPLCCTFSEPMLRSVYSTVQALGHELWNTFSWVSALRKI